MKFVLEGEKRIRRLENSKKLKLDHSINVSRGTPEKSKLMQLVPKAIMQRSDSAHRKFFKGRQVSEGSMGIKRLHRRIVSKNQKQDGAFKAFKKFNVKQIEGGERATKTLIRNPNSPAHGKLRVAQFMGKTTKNAEDRLKGPINKPSKNPHKNNGESPHTPYESVQEGSASINKLRRAVNGSKKIDFLKHMDMQNQIHNKKKDGAKRFEKNAASYKENPKFKTFGQGLSRSKSYGKNLGKPETRSGDSAREKYTRQEILKKKLKGSK